jgi:U2-associated protein SR140
VPIPPRDSPRASVLNIFSKQEHPREEKKMKFGSSKKRNIEELMAELQDGTLPEPSKSRRRGEHEERRGGGGGSFDVGDPETTNLYVGNMHPQVTEDLIMKTFGKFGPVSSVKVMWPRTEEEKGKTRLCGFVNMMHRRDAEAARDGLNNKDLMGLDMKIGWGKAVPRNTVPCYVHKEGQEERDSFSDQRAEIIVRFPNDPDARELIDKIAMFVARMGPEFERAVISREQENPDFAFLWEPETRNAIYYKWRVFSLTQSDTLDDWRRRAFQMFLGGVTWVPPRDEGLSDKERRRSRSRERERSRSRSTERDEGRGATLSDAERDKLETALRRLTAERADIGDAMVFALSRAEAAQEIVECISESLTILETPIPSKIARLFLVSDILHNSSAAVRKASLFRSCFEKIMPEVFDALGDKLRASDVGRITAEAMREKVTRVLRVWEAWSIFSEDFIQGLEARFLGTPAAAADDIDGQPLEADLDGEDLDGAPLDGEPIDGEPLQGDGDDEDGYNPNLPISKWNRPPEKGAEGSDEEGYNPNLPPSKWNKPPGS